MFTHYDTVHTLIDIVHTHFGTVLTLFTCYDTVHTHFNKVDTHLYILLTLFTCHITQFSHTLNSSLKVHTHTLT